jgi:hypothetical protein
MNARRLSAALAALAALALAGCGSNGPIGTSINAALIGTYDLVSLQQGDQPAVGPPVATGTLTLADSTYTVHIDITIPNDSQDSQTIDDAGTYTINANSWTQTSTVQDVQSIGTYVLSDGTLSVNVTTAGQVVKTVWQKQ